MTALAACFEELAAIRRRCPQAVALGLLGILVVAGCLRLIGIGYGLPFLYKPDEATLVHLAGKVGAQGNPHWILYPHLSINLLFVFYGLLWVSLWMRGVLASPGQLKGYYIQHPAAFYWIGRLTSVTFGLGGLAVQAATALRFFTPPVALASTLVLTLSDQHVSVSRWIKADPYAAFFAGVTLYLALRILTRGGKAEHLLAGAATGLAASSLYNALLVALAPLAAMALRARGHGGRQPEDAGPPASPLKLLVLATLTGVAAFAVTSPFLVSDTTLPARLGREVARMATARRGADLAGGEAGWVRLGGQLAHDHGGALPLALLALGALAPLALTGRGEDDDGEDLDGATPWAAQVVLLAPFVGLFLLFGNFRSYAIVRYLLPGYAGLLLASFRGWDLLARRALGPSLAGRSLALLALALLFSSGSLGPVIERVQRETRTDTRTIARAWVLKNIPPKSRILLENNAPPIKGYDQGGVPALEIYSCKTMPNFHAAFYGGSKWVARTEKETPTLDQLRDEGFDYVIFNLQNEARYAEAAALFPVRLGFYQEVRDTFPMVYSIDPEPGHPGVSLEIFRVVPRAEEAP